VDVRSVILCFFFFVFVVICYVHVSDTYCCCVLLILTTVVLYCMDLIACCNPASILTSSISSPVFTDNGSVKLCMNVNINVNMSKSERYMGQICHPLLNS
jgi:hypothetical protein